MNPTTPDAGKSETGKPEASAPETPEIRKGRVRPAALVFGLLVLTAGGFGLYEIANPPGKNVAAHAGACAKSLDVAQTIAPLTRGELAAMTTATRPNELSSIAFDDTDGRKTSIASFRGKTVLLNLWATWCVPCRAEMPSLDKLQSALGAKDFSVVAVNIDQTRLDKPKIFLKEIGADALPFYSDKSGEIVQTLKQTQKIIGLPTSVLIGADGCEIGTMAGPAQWDSPEAKALIQRVQKADPGKAV